MLFFFPNNAHFIHQNHVNTKVLQSTQKLFFFENMIENWHKSPPPNNNYFWLLFSFGFNCKSGTRGSCISALLTLNPASAIFKTLCTQHYNVLKTRSNLCHLLAKLLCQNEFGSKNYTWQEHTGEEGESLNQEDKGGLQWGANETRMFWRRHLWRRQWRRSEIHSLQQVCCDDRKRDRGGKKSCQAGQS